MMRLTDKIDHEGRLFPYLISGLYDASDDIKQTVFEIIEDLGQQYEEDEENEVKLRETKQFGAKSEWTFSGKIKDSDLTLPFPIAHRPRMGSRVMVRSYVRRYILALFKEISEWMEEHRERASNLLLYSLIYSEEYMTQYMDTMLVALYKQVLQTGNKALKKNIPLILRYIGRYCMPYTYEPLIFPAIKNELAAFYSYT